LSTNVLFNRGRRLRGYDALWRVFCATASKGYSPLITAD